ncbi:MAG TPA: TetR/AcrR family transcriptional regulator [Armatimonadota bacterium]|nr:TetR/AcrR family transcriptional regulator [Armatimonadota bacterium]
MPGRKHHESNDMRERILLSAEKVFAQKGYAAASIRELCEAAGVNRALIYYYFTDKAELYRAVLANGDADLLRIARNARDYSGSALDKLRVFITESAKLHMARPSMMEMVIRLERDHDHPEGVVPPHKRLAEPPLILIQILTDGIAAGELRPMHLDTMLHLIFGMSHSLVVMQTHSQSTSIASESIDELMAVLAHGIALS